MQLAGVAKDFTENNLQLLKQIGIDHLVYYNMRAMPADRSQLMAIRDQAEANGLRLSVAEGGPPMDRIVLGKEGRDEQIQGFQDAIRQLGDLGVKVLCYNFMPQVTADAMVVRTSVEHPDRGGALTSRFRLADFDPESIQHGERPTTDEQMWDNLEYFLARIVPVAEEAEVLLAIHPDDPPISPLCGLARIMRSEESFQRLLSISDSPVNGITLCQGCFAEMASDLPSAIRRFGSRINFVHFRDIVGTPDDFYETFPDRGCTDMVAVLKTYQEVGYDGYIRVDHAPLLASENGPYDGYGMHGHIFATGYLKGLMEPIYGKQPPAP